MQGISVVGLDVGHSAVKLTISEEESYLRYIFPTAVCNARKVPGENEARESLLETVEVDGQKLFVGETAKFYSLGKTTTYQGLTDDWIQSREHRALITQARNIAFRALKNSRNLVVVSGLPVAGWMRDDLRGLLKRQIADIFGITPDRSLVVSQAHGLYSTYAIKRGGKLNQDAETGVGIADIGFYTTDILSMINRRVLDDASMSVEGISEAVKRFISGVREKVHDFRPTIHEAHDFMLSGKVHYFGEEIDVSEERSQALRSLAQELADSIKQCFTPAKMHIQKIFVGGGGVALLGPYLQEFWPNINLMLEDEHQGDKKVRGPRFLVSEGYARIGENFVRSGKFR